MAAPSLSRRLVVVALLWIAAAIAIGGYSLSYAFARSTESGFDARLNSLALALLAATEVDDQGRVFVARSLGETRFERIQSGWYWQIEDGTKAVVRSRSLWDQALGESDREALTGPGGMTLRVATRVASLPGRERPLRFRVAASDVEIRTETERFDRLLAGSLGLLGLGLSAAVFLQVGYGLRPLRRLEADLEWVRSGRIPRLPASHPREVASVAAEMNRVLDHDEALIERARHHVANLAHALKTPLSVIRVEIAGLPAGSRRLLEEQTARMERLVHHHLGRAAASGASRGGLAKCLVAPLAEAVCIALRRIHHERGIDLRCHVVRGLAFHGERQDLEEILGNLVDNACKWARCSARVVGEILDEGIRIVVEDDGEGLELAEAPLALNRGARLDETTSGSGLGLAIVRDLVALYGGELALGRSRLGGLSVEVRLPSERMTE